MVSDFSSASLRLQPRVVDKQTGSVRRFIMIAGISGADKQEKAVEILAEFQSDGFQVIDSAGLYPAGQADINCAVITDPYKVAAERIPQTDDSHTRCVVYVSPDQIREEREENKLPHNEDLVFVAVYARIRQAALNGDSIVFSAANLESRVRRSILQLLPHKMAFSKELIVVYSDAEKITNKHMNQKYAVLAATLQNDPPKKTEGWDQITTVGKNLFPRKDIPIKKTR